MDKNLSIILLPCTSLHPNTHLYVSFGPILMWGDSAFTEASFFFCFCEKDEARSLSLSLYVCIWLALLSMRSS
jgi:hypothetical protein